MYLPPELLCMIFEKCSDDDKLNLRLVCQDWHMVVDYKKIMIDKFGGINHVSYHVMKSNKYDLMEFFKGKFTMDKLLFIWMSDYRIVYRSDVKWNSQFLLDFCKSIDIRELFGNSAVNYAYLILKGGDVKVFLEFLNKYDIRYCNREYFINSLYSQVILKNLVELLPIIYDHFKSCEIHYESIIHNAFRTDNAMIIEFIGDHFKMNDENEFISVLIARINSRYEFYGWLDELVRSNKINSVKHIHKKFNIINILDNIEDYEEYNDYGDQFYYDSYKLTEHVEYCKKNGYDEMASFIMDIYKN